MFMGKQTTELEWKFQQNSNRYVPVACRTVTFLLTSRAGWRHIFVCYDRLAAASPREHIRLSVCFYCADPLWSKIISHFSFYPCTRSYVSNEWHRLHGDVGNQREKRRPCVPNVQLKNTNAFWYHLLRTLKYVTFEHLKKTFYRLYCQT